MKNHAKSWRLPFRPRKDVAGLVPMFMHCEARRPSESQPAGIHIHQTYPCFADPADFVIQVRFSVEKMSALLSMNLTCPFSLGPNSNHALKRIRLNTSGGGSACHRLRTQVADASVFSPPSPPQSNITSELIGFHPFLGDQQLHDSGDRMPTCLPETDYIETACIEGLRLLF